MGMTHLPFHAAQSLPPFARVSNMSQEFYYDGSIMLKEISGQPTVKLKGFADTKNAG